MEGRPGRATAAGTALMARRWQYVALFLLVAGGHFASRVDTSFDSRWTLPTAMSLLTEGDLDLDEYAAAHDPTEYRIRRIGGHLYHNFPPGPALFAVPVVAAVRLAMPPLLGLDLDELLRQRVVAKLEVLVSSLLVALATLVVVATAARSGATPSVALTTGLVFAFASPAWSTASRALWQHAPSLLLLSLGLHCLVRMETDERWATGVGLAMAASYWCRPTNAIATALVLAYVIWRDPRQTGGVLAVTAAAGLLLVGWSWQVYRLPLPPYYLASEGFGRPTPAALLGPWLSPSRGLFVWSPVLLLALLPLLSPREGDAHRSLLVGAVLLLHAVMLTCWGNWWGGRSIGPRMTCELLPFLALLLPEGLIRAWARGPALAWRRIAVGLLLALSLVVHARAANCWSVEHWNVEPVSVDSVPERLWDWADPQFLR